MRRRAILASLTALLAGCTGSEDGSMKKPSTPQTPTSTRTKTPSPTNSSTPDETPTPPWAEYELLELDRPSLSESSVLGRLDTHDCTELENREVVCPSDEARLSVSISTSTISLPSGEIELSVRNDADEHFFWNVASWEVAKYDGKSWRKLAPIRWTKSLDRLEPGSSHDYSISVDDTTFEDVPLSVDEEMATFHGLGPGVYGFVNDSGTSAPTRRTRFRSARCSA